MITTVPKIARIVLEYEDADYGEPCEIKIVTRDLRKKINRCELGDEDHD